MQPDGFYKRWPLHGPARVALLAAFAFAVAGCDGGDTASTPPGGSSASTDWQPRRPEFEAIAARLYSGDNEYLGRAQIPRYEDLLGRDNLTPEQRVAALGELARHHLRLGEVDAAITRIEAAATLAQSAKIRPSLIVQVLRLQGLVYLRQAEVENCVRRHNRECCIFPLAGGGVHTVREPAAKARASFEAALELEPGNIPVVWLLNIVAMAQGEYPDSVPQRHRLPPEAFRSGVEIGRFLDVAPELGVDTLNLCGGVIAEDFDGDGLIDIVTSTFDPSGPMTFYHNLGDGRFEDRSSASRLDDQLGGLNCIGADYDNDGDMDILVLRGAWLLDDGRIRNSLLRNNGDGTFTDVTHAAGLATPARPTQAAAWGDFDNDGDLDLYIANEARTRTDPAPYPSQLFRNNGDGTFTDIASEAGVTNDLFGKGVTAGDYDNDGDQDIYHQLGGFYPGDRFQNVLFLNPGHGNRFLTIRLVGTTTNRMAVGARIRLVVETPGGTREIHRAVGAVSSFGGSPLRQEIGLGAAESIRLLEIVWPTSGARQTFPDVPLDSTIRVIEGTDDYEVLSVPRFDLGRAAQLSPGEF